VKEAKQRKDPNIETGTLESLSGQVELLHKHLLEMRLEDVLGKEVLDVMTDPQAAARNKLVAQLSTIKSMKIEERTSDSANTKGSGKMNYSLMVKPENARLQSQTGVQKLSARISALENLIGTNEEDLSILSMETGRKTLSESISVLSAKTTILEPKNLDHIEGRLAVLQQKLNRDESETSQPEDQADIDKIKELADMNKKSSEWAGEVPDLIDRMEALSPLHSQAAELSQSLLELETVQKQLLIQTSNNSSLLKEVEKRFQSNLKNIEKNFENLQQRIDALKSSK